MRDGQSVESVIRNGKNVIGRKLVLPGVEKMLESIDVEATFADGTKSVRSRHLPR